MTTQTNMMTLQQIRQTGLDALLRELGPVGMVRFLQQFEAGQGDYTQDRHTWLAESSLSEVISDLQQWQGGEREETL